MYPRVLRIVTLSLTAVVAAVLTTAGPAPAQSADKGVSVPDATTVAGITDTLAHQLASSLAADARHAGLFSAAADNAVSLTRTGTSPALSKAVDRANRAVLAAKGLPADSPAILEFRLAHPDMRAAVTRGEAPLVAAAPTDDVVTDVTAYDRDGRTVVLDATRMPKQPVFVVGVDSAKALPLGLDVFGETLAEHGIAGVRPVAGATGGYWATKVQEVRLNDDMEPWIKGSAEVFGITGGFGLDGKVAVDTVTMPYLDNDGRTYYPNQLIVHFSSYKYNLADFVMMEDDGDTNYLSLALAIAGALLTIVDGGVYIPLVNAILNALPSSWWTDDPDYVDSWYTLSTASNGAFNGAAGNGRMVLTPYWVQPL
jgi:hypothetical protein